MKQLFLLIGWIVMLTAWSNSVIAQDSALARGGHSDLEAA